MNSFRLRLTLLIVLMSSSVLLAMGWLLIKIVEQSDLEAIDKRLHVMGRSQTLVPHPQSYWIRFDRHLTALEGKDSNTPIFFRISDGVQNFTMASAGFPEFDASSLSPLEDEPERILDPDAPLPQQNSGTSRRGPEAMHGPDSGSAYERGPRRRRGPESRSRSNRPPPPRDTSRYTARGMLKIPATETVYDSRGVPYRLLRCGIDRIELWLLADLRPHQVRMDVMRYRFGSITVGAVALLALMAWWIGRRALAPIQSLSRTAASVTAQDLSARIEQAGSDQEFCELIDTMNSMLARLEVSFEQATRFTADAAHELQSPLTAMQLQLDDALQHAVDAEKPRYAGFMEDVSHLKSIVQKLLILARADSGTLPLQLETVDLVDILEQLTEDVELFAPELTVHFAHPRHCAMEGDETLLRQVMSNLIQNAIRYNRKVDGEIRVELERHVETIVCRIENTTQAQAPDSVEQLFERFYRADKARERKEGLGLGLSLVKEIVQAHQGSIRAEFASGERAIFICSFPIRQA